ncbi:peptidoglycan-binding domain-containing protein [Pseudotabrizicola alkalilacus]|uniref:Peptidoglycan-binding protein n=1 Tax=Pseudotabrizicola alkalilacus TaxID=2305252 RepID=A0A411YXH6_9RHOB|nr:peptidoglycan-binding domain-containing protein [Pseudotabrizicola alkalilacus]RGP35435.1 peptidoglycan-binding protein [Pseudotabrizicola alkalilacus]
MRLTYLPLITLAALGLAAPLFAETADGDFSVRGIGAQTCSTLTDAAEEDGSGAIFEYLSAWVAGYATHANRVTSGLHEVMPITDNLVLARVVVALCQANPQALTETVLNSLITSLADAAVPAAAKTVEITNADQTVLIPLPTFILVQQHLVDAGRLPDLPGSIDGQYGPQTRDALIAHQQSAGLTKTGLPDPATLLSMFAKAP